MKTKLEFLYGKAQAEKVYPELLELIEDYRAKIILDKADYNLSEKDVFLITYGDQVFDNENKSLKVLKQFLDQELKEVINSVHILPFYPYSSDDGFSVIDYKEVDSAIGDWDDIRAISSDYRLMADGVINHISAKSQWLKACLEGDLEYKDFFIDVDPELDLSLVTRPRALPLLTQFDDKWLWSTFSEDQLDLNFANPKVLLKVLDVLFFYLSQGAKTIRLDAIAYLWKEIGTNCIHLEQTHVVVKLMRQALQSLVKDFIIITETNVPHAENVSYFGQGDEAQMVYQFSLPPLIAHALLRENTKYLSTWAKNLELPLHKCTYFNFTASHDGIGMRPLEGILDQKEINWFADRAKNKQGFVSYKTNTDGTKSPYELNVNFYSLLSNDNEAESIRRFLLSQAVMLVMPGVPAIYFHSIVGSVNDSAGVKETGRNRSINREKLEYETLLKELKTNERRNKVLNIYRDMLKVRTANPEFSPYAGFEVIEQNEALFIVKRSTESSCIFAVFNLTGKEQVCDLPAEVQGAEVIFELGDVKVRGEGKSFSLGKYSFVWLYA